MTQFRTRYRRSPRLQTNITGESKTRQSEKDNCDVNKIMERFVRTGQITHINNNKPRYGEAMGDYQTYLQVAIDAKTAFGALTPEARKYFNNDPERFLEALEKPTDQQKKDLIKLGLMQPIDPTERELLSELVTQAKKPVKPVDKKPGNSDPT